MKKLMLLSVAVLFVSSVSFGTLINQTVDVPEIAAITVDGDLSDWADSSVALQWGDWNVPAGGSSSVGEVVTSKYAFNDAADMIYIAVESTKAGVALEIGTPTFDGTAASQYSGGITVQTALYNWLNGEPDPTTVGAYPSISAAASASIDVKYTVDGTTGDWTYEIAMPIWSNWSTTTGSEAPLALSVGDVLWGYIASPGDDLSQCVDDNEAVYHYGGRRDTFATKMTLVPEPATMALLGLGGLLLRRKRK